MENGVISHSQTYPKYLVTCLKSQLDENMKYQVLESQNALII